MISNPDKPIEQILKLLSKMIEGYKKQCIADVKAINYLLQAIPNDIYNSVDARKNAKDMWERIKRLMFSFDVTSYVRHSRIMDEFDKITTKKRESLESVYERLTTPVNIMDRNNVRPIPVSVNTKFLNCLQPEWSKYVTMVRHNQTGDTVSYDELEQMLLAMKYEAGGNLNDEENDFMLDNSYGDEILEELVDAKLSSYDRIVYKMGQSIQTIHMLGKEPNKVYDPFLKARLGYKNLEGLKKAIAAQPKMYHGEMLHSTNLKIDSPDFEESLKDAEESRLKIKNKMVQLNYEILNTLYEICVPQQEPSTEQTYFSIPSTSNICSETKEVTSDLPIPKMPKESKLLKMFEKIDVFLLSHEKCVARYALSRDSKVKRDLFTTPIAARSKNLGSTSVVAKSRLSVAITQTATNKVAKVSTLPSVFVSCDADLDNLFGPLYKEYYSASPPEVSNNFVANTLDNEDTSSSSSIVVEEDEAPQIVSSSAEQVISEPITPVLNANANELVKKDVSELNGNVFYIPPQTPIFEEAESSSTYQDLLNVHQFLYINHNILWIFLRNTRWKTVIPLAHQWLRPVGNKMHKAFSLLVRKFPLPEGTSHCLKKNATARRKVLPLPEVCTAIIVKEKPSVKGEFPSIHISRSLFNSQKEMDHQYPTATKIPVLDTGKFEQWQFQIQQYLQHEHYALWE
nr:hypothetical protein [Tanacetum cinerariifolium]